MMPRRCKGFTVKPLDNKSRDDARIGTDDIDGDRYKLVNILVLNCVTTVHVRTWMGYIQSELFGYVTKIATVFSMNLRIGRADKSPMLFF